MAEKGEGSFRPIIFIMLASLAIAFFWDSVDFIKETVHLILDPSAGALLGWNLTIGVRLRFLPNSGPFESIAETWKWISQRIRRRRVFKRLIIPAEIRI